MNWNPIFNIVIEVKKEYNRKFNDGIINFKQMLSKLNDKKYNDIFDCLQINQENNFLLIRYGLAEMQKGMWEDSDSIYRECRSIVIDLKHEQLVLTPFRKFFNLNEVEENKLDIITEKIQNAQVVEIVDKLDGSMQSARWYDDRIFMAGSMALNPKNSWRLQEGYNMLTENHKKLIKDYPSYTFIFEFISLKDAHVVKYTKKQEGLYLIGIRNTFTGRELNYEDIERVSHIYNVPMANIENIDLDTVLNRMKYLKSNEKEGWILNIDGHKVKIKCDDYVQLHRLLDKISSVNVIIKNIAENKVDDMVSKLPNTHKDRIEKIIDIITQYVVNTELEIEKYYNLAPKEDRKTFMIWVNKNVPKSIIGYVRNKFLGKDYKVLRNGGLGYKTVKELGLLDKITEVTNGC